MPIGNRRQVAEATCRAGLLKGARCGGALALIAGVALFAPPALAITAEEFLASPGAQAFTDGRYQDAIDGFEALLVDNPGDPTIRRYIAIAYQQLGDHQAAVDTLDSAIADSPGTVALHYYRALSRLELGDADGAVDDLNQVVALEPSGLYAQQAATSLAALGAGDGTVPALGDRPWDASLEVGLQYDSNVPSAASDAPGPKAAFRAYEALSGAYRFDLSDTVELEASGDAYLSQHLKADLNDFDVMSGTIGLAGRYADFVGELPFALETAYELNGTLLDGELFSYSHSLRTSAVAAIQEIWLAEVFHEISLNEFTNNGELGTVTSRDAIRNDVGTRQYVFVDGRESYVFAGYTFGRNLASGSNFDFYSHEVEIGGVAQVTDAIQIDGTATYTYQHYPNFIGTTTRSTDQYEFSLGATTEIFDNVDLSAGWTYTDENSSIQSLDYNRHIGTISIGYTF